MEESATGPYEHAGWHVYLHSGDVRFTDVTMFSGLMEQVRSASSTDLTSWQTTDRPVWLGPLDKLPKVFHYLPTAAECRMPMTLMFARGYCIYRLQGLALSSKWTAEMLEKGILQEGCVTCDNLRELPFCTCIKFTTTNTGWLKNCTPSFQAKYLQLMSHTTIARYGIWKTGQFPFEWMYSHSVPFLNSVPPLVNNCLFGTWTKREKQFLSANRK